MPLCSVACQQYWLLLEAEFSSVMYLVHSFILVLITSCVRYYVTKNKGFGIG
jgi:hypothetical protein